MFSRIILPKKLRVITVPDKTAQTATVMVLVGAGSKYETKENNGISHFLEHMFFKGTKKRPTTMEIAETLDKIGGTYNAFTSKEFTGYWAKVMAEHLDIALDWVSDIFLNSKIEQKEIDKEKGVIIEELNMYLDTPMRYIEDLWEKLLYGDQPAGWQTLGTEENILKFQRKDFLDYLQSHYSSLNTVICLAGNIGDEKQAIKKVESYFKDINLKEVEGKEKVIEKQNKPRTLLYFKETDQTHLYLGVRGYNLFSKQRYAQELLSIILGGNMSSRLFTSVRERRGLAYYIHTYSELYTDSGYLATATGIPNKKVEQVASLILKEYKDIRENGVSESELQKAKNYLKGKMALSLESSDSKASFYGMQELLSEKITDLNEKFKLIDKVGKNDIFEVAKNIFKAENLNMVIIGPYKDKEKFQNILNYA